MRDRRDLVLIPANRIVTTAGDEALTLSLGQPKDFSADTAERLCVSFPRTPPPPKMLKVIVRVPDSFVEFSCDTAFYLDALTSAREAPGLEQDHFACNSIYV